MGFGGGGGQPGGIFGGGLEGMLARLQARAKPKPVKPAPEMTGPLKDAVDKIKLRTAPAAPAEPAPVSGSGRGGFANALRNTIGG